MISKTKLRLFLLVISDSTGTWTDVGRTITFCPTNLDFFHSADHTVANVEGALIDAVDDGSRGIFFHSMNPAATRVLKLAHADIWVSETITPWMPDERGHQH